MIKKRKICVVTGARAEYGLLSSLMELIKNDKDTDLQTLVTGAHLSHEFGLTYREIDQDGFKIDKKIEMILSADTPSSIIKSTGVGMIGFADALKDLKPDILVLLGDRYELMSASFAALILKIPVAHIHGGEVTEGAFDDSIRHSISKMSWWHFTACEEYKKRLVQLGENPKKIFNVGGLGVDKIKNSKLLSKSELAKQTGIKFKNKNLLITFHPVTLENESAKYQVRSLMDALDRYKDTLLIFTMPNADSNGREIFEIINNFVSENNHRAISFTSMGSLLYLSTLQFVDGVIGNSSSGLLEAPTFKIGTVNIGDRQKGRIKANSIIDCKPTKESINAAIKTLYSNAFRKELKQATNPYGNGNAAEKIFKTLKNEPIPKNLKKEFFDI